MSSPFGKLLVICNARAGQRRVTKNLDQVRTHLEGYGLDYEVRLTGGPGDATRMARAGLDAGRRLLVAMGGDGTIQEIVNGMVEDDKPVNPEASLGVIPAGTGSDFIRTFGLPSDPANAVRRLCGDYTFSIDVGKVSCLGATRYFANIAEAGIGAAVAARAVRLPRWLGGAVYPLAFWLTLLRFKPAQVSVDLVDRAYEGAMNNLVVANCQYFGAGMKIAPRAAPTDGLLDVQIEHAKKREAIALLPKVYRGEHLPHPDVVEAKRARVSIESDPPLLVEADGEVLGRTPARFEVVKNALRLKT